MKSKESRILSTSMMDLSQKHSVGYLFLALALMLTALAALVAWAAPAPAAMPDWLEK